MNCLEDYSVNVPKKERVVVNKQSLFLRIMFVVRRITNN